MTDFPKQTIEDNGNGMTSLERWNEKIQTVKQNPISNKNIFINEGELKIFSVPRQEDLKECVVNEPAL